MVVADYICVAAAPVRADREFVFERRDNRFLSPKTAPRKLGMKGRFK